MLTVLRVHAFVLFHESLFKLHYDLLFILHYDLLLTRLLLALGWIWLLLTRFISSLVPGACMEGGAF